MDSSRIQTLPAQHDLNFDQALYLPTYEESNAPYSLCLPSFPYPPIPSASLCAVCRYVPQRATHGGKVRLLIASRFDQVKVECDLGDKEPLLDLSILNTPFPHLIAKFVASPNGRLVYRNQEGRTEELLDGQGEITSGSVNLDVINTAPEHARGK
ncbi:hypothetical protein AX14_001787 [Amanita brunnescens Koide BX004]|nr:hypothetical protein AX14_001787 [Amanita brunnescens Koide BX004]